MEKPGFCKWKKYPFSLDPIPFLLFYCILLSEGKMIDVGEWNWVVNKSDMTCKNLENAVTVKMDRKNGHLEATLHDMPMELFAEIAGNSNGERIIERIVRTAGKEYLSSENRM